MSQLNQTTRVLLGSAVALFGAMCVVASICVVVNGQGNSVQEVGGISIDTNGVLSTTSVDEQGRLRKLRQDSLERIPQDMQALTPARKVSLRALDEALAQSLEQGKPLADAMTYLAGLQRIEYVFVYPEQRDLVLVGPAEGWKLDARGAVVGLTTGRPVMLLDDLLVALRTARQAKEGISCSIDPTPEGLAKLRQFVAQIAHSSPTAAVVNGIEQSLGLQQISVSGVPATTHFAQVLVAADYRMKRLAMGLDPSPVRGLPNYLSMIQTSGAGMSSLAPRWWLAPQYEPLVRDAAGLAWELRLANVKALTEEEVLTVGGQRRKTGKVSPLAQKWADAMTAHYAELAVADPVFGQLRNCMELAILGALVAKEDLTEKANASLPTLMGSGRLQEGIYPAPKQVASKASVMQKGSNWVISASGGVKIQSWQAAANSQQGDNPAANRAKCAPATDKNWWWN